MSAYSHRDHRSYRAAYRLIGLVTGATLTLVGLSFLVPWPVVGVLALLGLAALGGGALWESGRLTESYADDLRRAHRHDAPPSLLRVEVHSRVELDRPVFVGGRPSPHARRPRRGGPTEIAPRWSAGDRA